MKELIAKRYAKALMESVDKKKLDSVIGEIKTIDGILNEPDAKEVILSPVLSGKKKFEMFIEPMKKKINNTVFQLLEIMSEKNRLDLLGELREILEYEVKKQSNKFEGTVAADRELNEKDIKDLEKVLNTHSGASIDLKQVDKSFDGLRVVVSDLGLELSFSKARVKSDLLDYIQKAL